MLSGHTARLEVLNPAEMKIMDVGMAQLQGKLLDDGV